MIKSITNSIAVLWAFVLLATLGGCHATKECARNQLIGKVKVEGQAPSAGCLVIRDQGVLLVKGLNDKVSFPGGSANDGELAACTALRETYEETGLDVIVHDTIRVFENGFVLFECRQANPVQEIDPPRRGEVKNAFYVAPEKFSEFNWRFENQQRWTLEFLKVRGQAETIDE